VELIGSELVGEFESEARERPGQRDPEDWQGFPQWFPAQPRRSAPGTPAMLPGREKCRRDRITVRFIAIPGARENPSPLDEKA
jgi:hypothetical protein